MPTRRRVSIPPVVVRLSASVEASPSAPRTAVATFYTGVPIARFDFFDGPYTLEFSMAGADFARFNAGAPVQRNHSDDLADQVGVVERAWIADGKALAQIRFSERPDVDALWEDVRAGIVRNVSMQATLLEVEDRTTRGGAKTLRAKKWLPTALAIVPVGADPGAQFVALSNRETRECVYLGGIMDTDDTEDTTTPTPEEKTDEKRRKAALVREARIHRLAKAFERGDLWAVRMIDTDLSADEIAELAAEERAKRAPKTVNDIGFGFDHDAPASRIERLALGLAARARGGAPDDAGREFYEFTLADAAAECLALGGRRAYGRRPGMAEVRLALTTADYPNLLANTAQKLLLPQYEAAQPTYRLLAARRDLPDFKTASVLKAGDFPVPLQVGEAGEIQLGSFSEAKDTYALATYGRRLLFSLQSLVNDDLNAFARVMADYATRLADLENSIWFSLLTTASGAGPTLGDGGALFNATAVTTAGGHANLTSSGTAISVDSLGVGRAAIQKQTSLDGLKLNITPRYLLASPDKRTLAEQHVTAITPPAAASANPFASRLEVLSDANLTSANPWYLFADPARNPVSVYGYLQGQAGPDVATRAGFEVLGVEMRVAMHFGCAFVDFRGAYRNAGA